MSIMAWRMWTIANYTCSGITNSPLRNNILYGIYGNGMPWLPGEVEQAFCTQMRDLVQITEQEFNYLESRNLVKDGLLYWANCPIPIHEHNDAPFTGCSCGIYALKSDRSVFDSAPFLLLRPGNTGVVIGIVELWGRIFQAEFGYRAQYARIRALIKAPVAVCETYQVPNLSSVEYARKEYFS